MKKVAALLALTCISVSSLQCGLPDAEPSREGEDVEAPHGGLGGLHEPTPEDGRERSALGLLNSLTCVGLPAMDYFPYGCFCGWGNSGANHTPIDASDAICRTHDECWDTGIAGCDCKLAGYTMECVDGVPTCAENNTACGAACCACDAALVTDLKEQRPNYLKCGARFPYEHCRETPSDCSDHGDCLASQRCVDGSCQLFQDEDLPQCEENAHCPSGMQCKDGACAPVCEEYRYVSAEIEDTAVAL